jgi:hypothetical protein
MPVTSPIVKLEKFKDDREVSAAMEPYGDFALTDGDIGGHIDQVAEDLSGLSIVVTAHAVRHQAIETAGEYEQGHIEVDLKADG